MRETFALRWVYVAVAAILLALLAGGILWWSLTRQADDERQSAVQLCVDRIEARDPVTEVRSDLARGEDRPIFVSHGRVALRVTADGIPGCEADFSVEDGIRHSDFEWELGTDETLPVCCDRDPVPNACGQAQNDWIEAYNSELARVKPEIVEKYCVGPETGE